MMRLEITPPGWLFITCIIYYSASCYDAALFENETGPNDNNNPIVFSPRMDYDEWTPLGLGDPLKNDPTFDYVPPILDRVQYWMDSHTTETAPKSDILVLGVTAKKTSPKIPDQFLKFVSAPKFMRNQETPGGYMNDFTGSRGAEPPKVIRKTNFRNGMKDYRNKDRIESFPASYYPSPYYNQNLKPETMMMPPPVVRTSADVNRPHRTYENPSKHHLYSDNYQYSTQTEAGPIHSLNHQIYDHPQNSYFLIDSPLPPRKHYAPAPSDRQKMTTHGTSVSHMETINNYTPSSDVQHIPESTTASVSSVKSNLIYQSSQTISGGWLAKTRQPTLPSLVDPDGVTWQSGTSSDNREFIYDEESHQAAGSSHHEVVLGPNANIIVEGDTSDKEEIVIGQKDIVPPSSPASDGRTDEKLNESPTALGNNSENMFIVLANSSPSSEITVGPSKKESAVTVVMPEKFSDKNVNNASGEYENLLGTKTSPLANPLAAEIGKLQDEMTVIHSAEDVSTHPQAMILPNDVSTQASSPTRLSLPHQQSPTPQPPHRQFLDASSQRVIHNQLSHARPAQVMSHYGAHVDSGMALNFQEPLPPPHHHSRMPMGHVQPDLRYQSMQPLKTSMMTQSGIGNSQQHVPPHRFHQQQHPQSLRTTVTSNNVVPSMTAIPFNSIRALLLKDEAQHNSQRMTEIIETPTLMRLKTSSDVSIPSIIHTTKNHIGSQLDVQINDNNAGMTNPPATHTSTEGTPTITSALTTTTAPALTTDPIFSHYKQPANPLRGPMYLIIQGHSKVKTYKPWVDKHGNQVGKIENVENTTSKQISEFEKFVKENTRKIADAKINKAMKKTTERPKEQPVGQDSLLSFIDSGLGAFPVPSSQHDLSSNNYNSLVAVNGN